MSEPGDLSRAFGNARTVAGVLAGAALLLYAASGLYVVAPEQRGVVLRFGQVVEDNVPPGMHYHWPWPVERVLRPATTAVRSLEIPFRRGTGNEAAAGELLTGDENLVQATLLIQFTVARPGPYLTTTAAPDRLLERISRWAAIDFFAGLPVDDALTTGRVAIQRELKQAVQALADGYGLGVRLTSVQLQSVEPPASAGVASAFKNVSSAREQRQRLVEQAEGERNRRLPQARSEAQRLRRDAEAYARESIERARGDSERFLAVWEEYRKAKSITTHRLYLEALETIMSRVNKVIINPRSENG